MLLVRDHELVIGGGRLLPGPGVGPGAGAGLLDVENRVDGPLHSAIQLVPHVIHCNNLFVNMSTEECETA